MSERISDARFSRRSILRGFSLSALALAANTNLAGDAIAPPAPRDQLAAQLEKLAVYEPSQPNPTLPTREQVAIVDNPRLVHGLGRSTIAYAVTHAGFVEAQVAEQAEILRGKVTNDWRMGVTSDRSMSRTAQVMLDTYKAGYETYRRNLEGLHSFLRTTNAPVVHFIEQADMENGSIPRPELAPGPDGFLLATRAATDTLTPNVTIETREPGQPVGSETHAQRSDLLFYALRQAGVTEIRVAGEYSFNPWGHKPACLGGTTQTLMSEGFDVRGISGAVFPLEAPADTLQHPIGAALYDNAIPLSGIQ